MAAVLGAGFEWAFALVLAAGPPSLLPPPSSELVDASAEASLGDAGVSGSEGTCAAFVLCFLANLAGEGSSAADVWVAS